MDGEGCEEIHDIRRVYVERLVKDYKGTRELKVAWDPGNGGAGEITKMLTRKLPGEHVLINTEIDGTFPNHHPDPTIEANLEQLKALVANERCDLGIAFDGDGDRIGIVDSKGQVLWGDQILVILARAVLADQPGATIIADVKASRVFQDEINRLGGKPLLWKTGHSHIKEKLMEMDAPLAGEMSAHIFFKHCYYGYDDAIYTSIRLLELINRGYSLKKFLSNVKNSFFTPEIKCECSDDKKFQIISNIILKLKKHYNENQLLLIDGIRVTNNHGWYLIRASNTENAIIVRAEGKSKKDKVLLLNEVKSILKSESIFLK